MEMVMLLGAISCQNKLQYGKHKQKQNNSLAGWQVPYFMSILWRFPNPNMIANKPLFFACTKPVASTTMTYRACWPRP